MSLKSRIELNRKLHSLQASRNFHLITLRESYNKTDRAIAMLEIRKLNFMIKATHKELYGS